jgi:hypothetical protein
VPNWRRGDTIPLGREGALYVVETRFGESEDDAVLIAERIQEGEMLILAIHQVPSLTQEKYEEVVRRLTGKSRIKSPSDLPFDGLLVHAAGPGPNGFCVFDVFESEEAVERFRAAMGTIPQEVGIEEPPYFFPAHTAMSVAI